MCLVEVKGARALAAACVYPVNNGMEVFTNTPALRKARKTTLELILSNHRMDCLSCPRNGNCELATLAKEYGVDQYKYGDGREIPVELDTSSPHLIRDNSKCILCRRCEAVCRSNQFVSVIGANERGFKTHIASPFDMDLAETPCINCGQCITVCPTGALQPKDDTGKVWDALADPSKHVVVGPAPSVRAQLGECFRYAGRHKCRGQNGLPRCAALALTRCSTWTPPPTSPSWKRAPSFSSASRMAARSRSSRPVPRLGQVLRGLLSGVHPEHFFLQIPQQMYGALMKTYYAEKAGIDPKDIFVVSVMPCTAKKFEIGRENQSASVIRISTSPSRRSSLPI